MKKLYLSRTDKKFAGVIGGIAEYLSVDATLLRVLWVLITVFTGIVPGIAVYIIAWLIMPLPPMIATSESSTQETT